MTEVTARELKNKTGAVLRTVRGGQSVVVTNRGRRIAVISPADATCGTEETRTQSVDEAWSDIERALRRSKPRYRTWREAMKASRGRP
jgi:prevent-host-death family protein